MPKLFEIIDRHGLSVVKCQNGNPGYLAGKLGDHHHVGDCYLDDEMGIIDGVLIDPVWGSNAADAVLQWLKQQGHDLPKIEL